MPNYDTVLDLAETIVILKQEIGKRDEWIAQRDRTIEALEGELERGRSGNSEVRGHSKIHRANEA